MEAWFAAQGRNDVATSHDAEAGQDDWYIPSSRHSTSHQVDGIRSAIEAQPNLWSDPNRYGFPYGDWQSDDSWGVPQSLPYGPLSSLPNDSDHRQMDGAWSVPSTQFDFDTWNLPDLQHCAEPQVGTAFRLLDLPPELLSEILHLACASDSKNEAEREIATGRSLRDLLRCNRYICATLQEWLKKYLWPRSYLRFLNEEDRLFSQGRPYDADAGLNAETVRSWIRPHVRHLILDSTVATGSTRRPSGSYVQLFSGDYHNVRRISVILTGSRRMIPWLAKVIEQLKSIKACRLTTTVSLDYSACLGFLTSPHLGTLLDGLFATMPSLRAVVKERFPSDQSWKTRFEHADVCTIVRLSRVIGRRSRKRPVTTANQEITTWLTDHGHEPFSALVIYPEFGSENFNMDAYKRAKDLIVRSYLREHPGSNVDNRIIFASRNEPTESAISRCSDKNS